MATEIERKLLLKELPKGLSESKGQDIQQGYLSVGEPEVRVRSIGGKFFVTSKTGEGFIRLEEEEQVSERVFQILWPATLGRRIEKTRYTVTGPNGLVWEVDEYHGHLVGLFIAEVELSSVCAQPDIPNSITEVCLTDVTEDKRFKNKALAGASSPPAYGQ